MYIIHCVHNPNSDSGVYVVVGWSRASTYIHTWGRSTPGVLLLHEISILPSPPSMYHTHTSITIYSMSAYHHQSSSLDFETEPNLNREPTQPVSSGKCSKIEPLFGGTANSRRKEERSHEAKNRKNQPACEPTNLQRQHTARTLELVRRTGPVTAAGCLCVASVTRYSLPFRFAGGPEFVTPPP